MPLVIGYSKMRNNRAEKLRLSSGSRCPSPFKITQRSQAGDHPRSPEKISFALFTHSSRILL